MIYDLDNEAIVLKAQRDKEFLEELLPTLEGVVYAVAKKIFPTARYDRDDMLQDGRIAAIEAINNYQPGRADHISKYIYACVNNRIKDEAGRCNNTTTMCRTYQYMYYRAKRRLREDPDATKDDLMDLGVKESVAEAAIRDMGGAISLDAEINEKGETMYVFMEKSTNDIDRAITNVSFWNWAEKLTEIERYYISEHLKGVTDKEMRAKRGVSQQAASRSRMRAKERLKKELTA